MSQIMKAYTGIFLMVFLSLATAGILAAFMQVSMAQDLHADIINEIENSNYNASVLKEAFQRTSDANYGLVITLYKDNYTHVVCHNASDVPADTSLVTGAKVEMEFPFEIGFFGVAQQHNLCGYAR